jgi:hypothetical protein
MPGARNARHGRLPCRALGHKKVDRSFLQTHAVKTTAAQASPVEGLGMQSSGVGRHYQRSDAWPEVSCRPEPFPA